MLIAKSRVIQASLAVLVCGATAVGCDGGSPGKPSPSPNRTLGKFTIVAGGGHLDPEQSDQPTQAEFSSPDELAVTPDGTLYIGEPFKNVVYRLPPNGHISVAVDRNTTFPASNGSTTESFDSPTSIATDSKGNIFIGDYASQAIRELTADGRRLTVAGANPKNVDAAHGRTELQRGDGKKATTTRLGVPSSLAVSPDQKSLYVTVQASEESSIIRRVTIGGNVETVAGRTSKNPPKNRPISQPTPATNVQLIRPTVVATDTDGTLLISGDQLLRMKQSVVEPLPGSNRLEALGGSPGKKSTAKVAAWGDKGYVIRINTSIYRISKDGNVTLINTFPTCTGTSTQATDYGDIAIRESSIYVASSKCRTIMRLDFT